MTYLKTSELSDRLREHPVRRAWIPMECRVSWFAPVQRADGKLYLAAFFYPVVGGRGEPKRVGRPRFSCTLDPATGVLVELSDCEYRDFAAGVPSGAVLGEITPETLPAATIPELTRLRDELSAAYDRILPLAFMVPERLTPEQRRDLGAVARLLDRMTEPFLRPFYHALNPEFFGWLETSR